jgi:hypothetical protein
MMACFSMTALGLMTYAAAVEEQLEHRLSEKPLTSATPFSVRPALESLRFQNRLRVDPNRKR